MKDRCAFTGVLPSKIRASGSLPHVEYFFSFTILRPLPGRVKEIGSDLPRDLERRLRFSADPRDASIAIQYAFFIGLSFSLLFFSPPLI